MKAPAKPDCPCSPPGNPGDWRDQSSRFPRGHAPNLIVFSLLFLLATIGGATTLLAQDETGEINREYTIKAAYLYNFGRYVQWPESAFKNAESPLVIGVLGPNPFGASLDAIASEKRIDDRPIVIRSFKSLAEYEPCHILFVVWSVGEDVEREAIQRLGGAPVLLVGETPNFAQWGGTVSFFVEENKLRFEINQETAKRQQLKISSKLLSLARLVGASAARTSTIADGSLPARMSRR